MTNLTQILTSIRQLTKKEQEQIVITINSGLREEEGSVAKLIEVKLGLQEKERFVCPHCSGENIVGHGNYNGRKRYKCKSCETTFNDLTGTSISHIHKKEEWDSYMQCLANNLSLREAAKQVGISLKTSFLWRHKIIGAFKDMGCTKLEGIIEGDETFFLFSEKGNKAIEDRKPRKRGGKASKAGINDEQVAVLVSTDRNKRPIIEVVGRGRVTTKQIEGALGKWIGEQASVLCTDSHRSYERFAKDNKLKHVKINASKGQHVKDKVYHIQNINNMHHLLKDWVKQFNGVATGYLQNYMNWFRIMRISGNDVNKYLAFALQSNVAYVSAKNIKPQYITT